MFVPSLPSPRQGSPAVGEIRCGCKKCTRLPSALFVWAFNCFSSSCELCMCECVHVYSACVHLKVSPCFAFSQRLHSSYNLRSLCSKLSRKEDNLESYQGTIVLYTPSFHVWCQVPSFISKLLNLFCKDFIWAIKNHEQQLRNHLINLRASQQRNSFCRSRLVLSPRCQVSFPLHPRCLSLLLVLNSTSKLLLLL